MSLLFPQQSTPSHTPCTSPATFMPTRHSEETCAPLQVRSIGSVADMDAPPGYEPNPFTEMSTVDPSQSSFHGLSMTLVYGFAESLATPPLDLEINDEQSTKLLASPRFPQEREASADRSQVYHSRREKTWCPTRPDFRPARRDPSRYGAQSRKEISVRFFKNSDRSFVSEAHSEILKQECRAEKDEGVILELQRQIQSIVWKWGNTYEESRRARTIRRIVSTRKSIARNSRSRNLRN